MTLPAQLWAIYARRVFEHEQRLGHVIHNQQAFEDAVALDGMRRLDREAERLWAMFVLTPVRLAECLIDGRPPRYAERKD